MKLFSILGFLALLLGSCSASKNAQNDTEKHNSGVVGTKWVLVELMGQPVEVSSKNKPYFILQPGDSSVQGLAGCNGFFGRYKLDEATLRISFSNIGSTLMACDDLDVENEFKKVLEMADNYSHNGNNLSLNKARMAPLARFEAVKE